MSMPMPMPLLLLPLLLLQTARGVVGLSAELTALRPGDPGTADVLLRWRTDERIVDDSIMAPSSSAGTQSGADLVGYRVEVAVAGSDAWTLLATKAPGTLGPPHADRHERQRIVTRVDSGQVIADGAFRLTLSHAGTSLLDMHQRTVTPPLAFDASADAVRVALESLDVITRVQVFRRVLDAAAQTIEWTVLFDPLDGAAAPDRGDLPLLALYSETLSAPYTGPGDQIAIFADREAALAPVLCVDDCAFAAEGLPVGVALSFRVRAESSSSSSLAPWRRLLEPLVVPPTLRPHAPSSPELVTAGPRALTIRWRAPPTTPSSPLFPVLSFQLEQQCATDKRQRGGPWRIVNAELRPGPSGETSAQSLPVGPNTTCVFRVAATNANGRGAFSPPSAPMTTLPVVPGPPTNVLVLRDPLRVTWSPPRGPRAWDNEDTDNDEEDAADPALRYELELREFDSTTWARVPSNAIDHGQCICILDDRHNSSSGRGLQVQLQLKPFTRYVTRLRAFNAMGPGAFAPDVAFVTDYRVVPRPATVSPSPTAAAAATLRRRLTQRATRRSVANANDHYYVHGVGTGGTAGGDGGPGLIVLFPVTAMGERLREVTHFFTGRVERIAIPTLEGPDADWRRRVVGVEVLAWGGGGGSGAKGPANGDGGGGAFARGIFPVGPGESLELIVGGGGRGGGEASTLATGARGGFHGGGDGGRGDFSGGGGGGASEVRIDGRTVLVAAGGGGGGASDYCCAHGGGGGGGGRDDSNGVSAAAAAAAGDGEENADDDDGRGEDGLFANADAIPLDRTTTHAAVRDEYHSRFVLGDLRDLLGLPARHVHLDYGRAGSTADYTRLATGGGGGSSSVRDGDGAGGAAGKSGSYAFSRAGECVVGPLGSSGPSIMAPFAAFEASPGRRGRGGRGQDGHDAGGGGGGGYYGGGGGGAGIDGAGGGGGSSFVSVEDLLLDSRFGLLPSTAAGASALGEHIANLEAVPVTSTTVLLRWAAPPFGFTQGIEGFVVEMANRSANEDFRLVQVVPGGTARELVIRGLAPRGAYRFRVRPLVRDAHGVFSPIVTLTMPPAPVNAWEPITRLRGLTEASTRAGTRIVDPEPGRRRPSARRGHTLTAFVDQRLYLFGGFGLGYPCNAAHKAACVLQRGVNNELWRLEPRLRLWVELPTTSTTSGGALPPPRERHTMSVLGDRLLLFGGRRDPVTALGDLWELQISSQTARTTARLQDLEGRLPLDDGRERLTRGNVGADPAQCVVDLRVELRLTHACPRSLRIELLGPGPQTFPQRQQNERFPVDSQARETTWSDARGLGTGRQRVTPTAPSSRTLPVTLQRPEMASDRSPCVAVTNATLVFASSSSSSANSATPTTPALEQLGVFHQLSASGGWTLSVSDTVADGLTGTLEAWDVVFTLAPCVPTFTWRPLTAPAITGTGPPARSHHAAIVRQSSLFVFGGRTTTGGVGVSGNKLLLDLYRLDYAPATGTGTWTTLVPLTTSSALEERRFHHGRTLVLTPYELVALGNGLRPRSTGNRPHTLGAVGLTARRRRVTTHAQSRMAWEELPLAPGAATPSFPRSRYAGSGAFLYGAPSNVTHPEPQLVLFGGEDDTTVLDDLWRLRLDALGEGEPRGDLDTRRQAVCDWRLGNAAAQTAWGASCGATAAMVAANQASVCSIESLLLYAWCAENYQTIEL